MPRTDRDVAWMRRVLRLARRGGGSVSPNPLVGAVVVRRGALVGEGHHRVFGGEHAEVAALRDAGRRAGGSTLYTNLEPCAHHGKTPPCVEAIVAAGVRRVVAGMEDPNSEVNGRGFRRLAAAGVEVTRDVLRQEAEALNRAFVKKTRTGLPLVTLKAGMTLDGRIATPSGKSRWITGERSRQAAHRLRAASDAVLIGAETYRADDPLLTARVGERRTACQPVRVVLAGRGPLPLHSRMLRREGGGPVIFYSAKRPGKECRELEQAGAEVVILPARKGRVSPRHVLEDLARRGLSSLLVEGGGEVIRSWLDSGLADRVHWFVAPKLLGAGRPVVGGPGIARPDAAFKVEEARIRRLGDEWIITGRPVRGD